MLKKTSIYLDEELDQGLARKAAEEGITKAEYIRRTLDASVHRSKRPKPKAIGLIKGPVPPDIAENAEQYMDVFGES